MEAETRYQHRSVKHRPSVCVQRLGPCASKIQLRVANAPTVQRNAQVIASFTAPLIQRHSPLCGTRDLGLSFRPNHLHIHGFRNVTERLNYEKCYLSTNFLSSDLHISRVKVIPDSIHFGAFGLHLHISLISSFDFFFAPDAVQTDISRPNLHIICI